MRSMGSVIGIFPMRARPIGGENGGGMSWNNVQPVLPAKPPPAKFCWDCGRKLRGKYFQQLMVEGYWRTMHKGCAEEHEAMVETERRNLDRP
mgnify:CR=1 FL=1